MRHPTLENDTPSRKGVSFYIVSVDWWRQSKQEGCSDALTASIVWCVKNMAEEYEDISCKRGITKSEFYRQVLEKEFAALL